MKSLLIVGTGGHAKVVLDCAQTANQHDRIGFLTNDLAVNEFEGFPVFHEQDFEGERIRDILGQYDEIMVAIGNNDVRLKKTKHFTECGAKSAVLTHPTATVSRYAQVGAGTVILANAVINARARLGMACIINTGAIVEHDCTLCDGVHASPNAAMGGSVFVGEKSWLCIGCNVANNLTIGQNSTIGAGAVVLQDVPDNVLVAGVPATIRKTY